jgi:NAD(P)-dependent dehydrogenase (short-subunit alcohol dehydrogenase family)
MPNGGLHPADTVALITGAASRIGAPVAAALHEGGVRKFALIDRDGSAACSCRMQRT